MINRIVLMTVALLITQNLIAQNTFPPSGNVGIGTDNPDANLHVTNATQAWVNFKLKTKRSIDGRGVNNYLLDGNDDGWVLNFAGHRAGQPLRFMPVSQGVNGIANMSLLDNGNVGIGTDDTYGYKLAVNGTIGAKEVIVENTSE